MTTEATAVRLEPGAGVWEGFTVEYRDYALQFTCGHEEARTIDMVHPKPPYDKITSIDDRYSQLVATLQTHPEHYCPKCVGP